MTRLSATNHVCSVSTRSPSMSTRTAVELEVVAIGVLREQLSRRLTHPVTHRDHGEGDDVGFPRVARPEEVGKAEVSVAALPREREATALAAVLVEDDDVVSLADAREI